MREIITLQFGNYSNHVCAHWWNVQELGFRYDGQKKSEINHDVLYREGLNLKNQVTFTPRTLLVDNKSNLQTLGSQNPLYDDPICEADFENIWSEKLERVEEEKLKESRIQQEFSKNQVDLNNVKLEDEVQHWPDYLYTRFHPRSVHSLKDNKSNATSVSVFPQGCDLWRTSQFQDDFADNIRNYVEECDSLQGFQIILDSSDLFAGLGTSCIEYIKDEFETKPTFCAPLINAYYDETEDDAKNALNDSLRVINTALCYSKLSEHSSFFVPMSLGETGWRKPGNKKEFNHVIYDVKSNFHTSAILAAALDTFTLKYRMKNSTYSLKDLIIDLSPHGRKASAASLCFPFTLGEQQDLLDCLNNWDGPLTKSITPNYQLGSPEMFQIVTLRGVEESRLKKPLAIAGKQKDMPTYKCESVSQMLKAYYDFSLESTASLISAPIDKLCVKKPFPGLFEPRIGIRGDLLADNNTTGVENVSVISGLHTNSKVGSVFKSLSSEVKKLKYAKFYQFSEAGLERDEFTESINALLDFEECYEDGYDML